MSDPGAPDTSDRKLFEEAGCLNDAGLTLLESAPQTVSPELKEHLRTCNRCQSRLLVRALGVPRQSSASTARSVYARLGLVALFVVLAVASLYYLLVWMRP